MPKFAMPMFTARRMLAAGGVAVLALAASACGSDAVKDSGASAAASAAAPAAPAAPSAAPSAPAAGAVRLVAVKSAALGPVVTDSAGRTLYRFDKDTAKPSASACVDACAAKWPPLTAQDAVKVTGVDPALVGSVARPDGTKQVTLNGWPLYRFAGDAAAGQTNGQGVGGTWFASTPEGKKAPGAAGQAASPAATQSGGYPAGY